MYLTHMLYYYALDTSSKFCKYLYYNKYITQYYKILLSPLLEIYVLVNIVVDTVDVD